MIYRMRNIVSHSEEVPLPTCMYNLKSVINFDDNATNENSHEPDLKITEQVIKFLKIPSKKMAELEQRQDHLLQQLDTLYERIKSLSSLCKVPPTHDGATQQGIKPQIAEPTEIVINASVNCLPYFLLILARGSLKNKITLTYHIHSSVPAESVIEIKEFMKLVDPSASRGSVNIKLIFKEVAANTELKLSSLMGVPVVGEVNVLRYLALVFPAAAPLPATVRAESLLDACYLLQRALLPLDKAARILFDEAHYKGDWILGEQMTVVDIAAFSAIKQMRGVSSKLIQCVPKQWFEKCNKLLLK